MTGFLEEFHTPYHLGEDRGCYPQVIGAKANSVMVKNMHRYKFTPFIVQSSSLVVRTSCAKVEHTRVQVLTR